MHGWVVEKRCWLCLHLAVGVGVSSFWKLIDYFGSATAAINNQEKRRFVDAGLGEKQINALPKNCHVNRLIEKEIELVRMSGVTLVIATDEEYPSRLKQLSDPPPVLYCRGDLSLLSKPSVAVVGSRAATSYGRRVANSLGRDLGRHGVTVVSGLALGIDSEAHWGSLDSAGKTVAVLGCGVDVIYPKQNRKLFEEIVEKGLVVSEYPMGSRPEGFRFPARNRIISGLSEGVVVVEAARKSGSLITAQLALDYNREVFAVPGQVDSYKSEGTHWLLQQGAKLVQGVPDVLEELSLEYPVIPENVQGDEPWDAGGSAEEFLVLDYLEPYPIGRESIKEKLGLDISKLSEILLLLELDGKIEILPGDEIRKLC